MRRYQIWSNMAERSMKFLSGWQPGDAMLISAVGEFPSSVECSGIARQLEFLFALFNRDDRPNGQIAHSLSVGDVVSLFEDDDRLGSWRVWIVGFEKVEFPEIPADGYAVWASELRAHGCPICGHRSGSMPLSCGRAGIWRCADGHECAVLADGMEKSTISRGDVHPSRTQHPRLGVPSHGNPDKRPEAGDFFRSRGIGMDVTPGCFMCDARFRNPKAESLSNEYMNNISAYVECKAAGERVAAMFVRPDGSPGARLDYRDFEPDYVQVKIGACEAHTPNLQRLHDLTTVDGIITAERLEEARR